MSWPNSFTMKLFFRATMSWLAATLHRLLRRFRRSNTHTSQPKVRSLLRYTTVRGPYAREMTRAELSEWESARRQKRRQKRWLDRRRPTWER